MATGITQGTVIEDSVAVFLVRIAGVDGVNLTQASLTAVSYAVFDPDGQEILSGDLVIADVIFDTLQTGDPRWERCCPSDVEGFNFRHVMPATAFPTGGATNRVEYKFTDTNGYVYHKPFDAKVLAIRTS